MPSAIEETVSAALGPLVDNRVFPDVAPQRTPRPYFTYQSVGGEDASTFDGPADTMNSRMQVNVWSDSRLEASRLMTMAIAALGGDPILGKPIGAPVSVYEQDTKLYGSRLDFSIWYDAQEDL